MTKWLRGGALVAAIWLMAGAPGWAEAPSSSPAPTVRPTASPKTVPAKKPAESGKSVTAAKPVAKPAAKPSNTASGAKTAAAKTAGGKTAKTANGKNSNVKTAGTAAKAAALPGLTAAASRATETAAPGGAVPALRAAGAQESPRLLTPPASAQSSVPAQDLRLAAAPAPRLSNPGAIAGMHGGLCGTTWLTGQPIPPIASRIQGCGLPDGVEVTAVSGVPLSEPVEVDCPTARAMQTWVERGILPAIGNMGGGLARIEIAGSYSCRPRDNVVGAQISEHGRGHAIDVSALVLRSGDVLSVARDWRTRLGPVLQRVHDTACGTFDTVLGPNSDRFHQDHIHVDTAPGRRGGAYCR
ncbi:extensin-like domain-containing protein [Paenirhodobacter enshiensis]|uniref:extensin-like domain-containing protein n=1 Tax=Paenirhodobacter enshiensis TaxID=1105367 RepID=UPI0035B34DAA